MLRPLKKQKELWERLLVKSDASSLSTPMPILSSSGSNQIQSSFGFDRIGRINGG